jgi:hypothetical protein
VIHYDNKSQEYNRAIPGVLTSPEEGDNRCCRDDGRLNMLNHQCEATMLGENNLRV